MASSADQSLKGKVAKVVELIRPAIQADNGDIELVDVTSEGVAQIRFHGECLRCPSKPMTLRHDIAKTLMTNVPGVTSVVAVD